MKIQVGEIVINKTKKYLAPCINVYGARFGLEVNTITKVGLGIGDMITVKSGVRFEKHLFILVDVSSKLKQKTFNKFLIWIKDQIMYEDDYVYDDVQEGCLHMVVIKFPEQHYKTYETFKVSQFSKMYTKQDVNKFFAQRPEVQKVLIKDNNYKIEFVKSLNKQFGSTISPDEFEGELDFPVRKEEEVFNVHIIKNKV